MRQDDKSRAPQETPATFSDQIIAQAQDTFRMGSHRKGDPGPDAHGEWLERVFISSDRGGMKFD